MSEEFEKKFNETDFSDCVNVFSGNTRAENGDQVLPTIEKSFMQMYQFKETFRIYHINLLLDEKQIGGIEFVANTTDSFIFVRDLYNNSIHRHTKRRDYCGVGSSLIQCLKKLAKICGIREIQLTAMILNTNIPVNNDLVKFYEKQGFTMTEEERNKYSSSSGFRMKFDNKEIICMYE